MDDKSLAFLTIREQAELLRSGQLSPVKLTEVYLNRIEQFNGQLNSYITVCRDEALAAAREAEREIGAGQYKGSLHGIPIAVKDQMYINGVRTTGGSKIYKDFVPDEDATVVRNLNRAGAILLGTLNTTEFHMGGTINFPFGTPRNPWDVERTPGGSSSGSGSAVASALCSGALGGDTGGSIRGPASFCGVTGLKPTWSRVSRYGVFPLCCSQDCVGPLARSVEDCGIILEQIAGYDQRDPTSSKEPVPNYVVQLDGDLDGVRIGVVEEMMDHEGIEAETRQFVNAGVATLSELGAEVGSISIPLMNETAFIHAAVIDTEAASYHREHLLTRYEDYDYNTRVRLAVGAILPAGLQTLALRVRSAVERQVIEAFDNFDILVGATSQGGAGKIQTESNIHSKEDFLSTLSGRTGGTMAFSMAGAPALSVPCGINSEGLPLGLQIAGRPFEEGLVFKVAHAYQRVTDWHKRRPPVS